MGHKANLSFHFDRKLTENRLNLSLNINSIEKAPQLSTDHFYAFIFIVIELPDESIDRLRGEVLDDTTNRALCLIDDLGPFIHRSAQEI